MAQRNFKDYDALNEGRPLFVRRIGGEDIEFRKVLPAKLVLDIRRQSARKMTEAEEEEFGFKLVEQIVGQEKYDHISSHLSTDQLMELFGEAMVYYGLAEEVAGKAEAPATETETGNPSPSSESSKSGEPSTQTSSGSTPTPDGPSTEAPSTGLSFSPVSATFPQAPSS